MENFMCDFEKGLRSAAENSFYNVGVIGCNFHYPQANWRNLMKHGYYDDFMTSEGFARSYKALNALAYVPLVQIEEVYHLLIGSKDFHPKVLEYTQNYWYDTWFADNGKYKPEDWNVFEW